MWYAGGATKDACGTVESPNRRDRGGDAGTFGGTGACGGRVDGGTSLLRVGGVRGGNAKRAKLGDKQDAEAARGAKEDDDATERILEVSGSGSFRRDRRLSVDGCRLFANRDELVDEFREEGREGSGVIGSGFVRWPGEAERRWLGRPASSPGASPWGSTAVGGTTTGSAGGGTGDGDRDACSASVDSPDGFAGLFDLSLTVVLRASPPASFARIVAAAA